MTNPGHHSLHEITTQPEAWAEAVMAAQAVRDALLTLWTRIRPQQIILTGCGSTHYLSLAGAAFARDAGLAARAVPASEVWLFPHAALVSPADTLLIAASRSGETTETLRAVDTYRRAGGQAVVAVTNYPQSLLAKTGDLLVAIPAGQEQSVAQTRSFASMFIAVQGILALLAGQANIVSNLAQTPDHGRRVLAAYADLAAALGKDMSLQRFFFLGNGPLYGLACEAMLKMKEMSLSYSEAYHVLEFRHGPMSMVNAATLVVGLISDTAAEQEIAVLADMQRLGARVLALAETDVQGKQAGLSHVVPLNSGLPAPARLVLYLPVLQLLAYHRAIGNGLDPDKPQNLSAVVYLN